MDNRIYSPNLEGQLPQGATLVRSSRICSVDSPLTTISDWFLAYLDSPDAKLQAESEADLRQQRFGYIPADYIESLWDSMINPEDPEMKEFLRHLLGP